MIANGKYLVALQSQLAGQFAKRRSLVKRHMAETGIDVVSDYAKVWYGATVSLEISMNGIHITVVTRHEANW